MKNELQNIISGKSQVRYGDTIQTIASYLRKSKSASKTFKNSKQIKSEEAGFIKQFCDKNSFWITAIDINAFVSSGAVQKVYLHNKHKVIKLNDSIYYKTWGRLFKQLTIKQLFFSDTAYQLIGFYQEEDLLYSVVEQKFVESDTPTKLDNVNRFLTSNGFVNTRNNDYLNPQLGIILEDLHDENVLTYQENLFFNRYGFLSNS
jgi:hypothetical protein